MMILIIALEALDFAPAAVAPKPVHSPGENGGYWRPTWPGVEGAQVVADSDTGNSLPLLS